MMRSQPRPNMMICPVCTIELVVIEKQDIEIDYCPQCRGVWLDRGELEEIINRTAMPSSQNYPRASYDQQGYSSGHREDYRDRHRGGHENSRHGEYRDDRHGGKHGRRSLLEDLFDF